MFYMFSKVPRGSINHSLGDSIIYFLKSFTANLKDIKKINEFESLFAHYNDRKYCVSLPFARTAIYFALKSKNLPIKNHTLLAKKLNLFSPLHISLLGSFLFSLTFYLFLHNQCSFSNIA